MTFMLLVSATSGFVLKTQTPVSVKLGREVILPCWLNPAQSAVNLEVIWYFGSSKMIFVYREKQEESPETLHKGRVSFGLKEPASAGLNTGDISLKLVNVTTEDAGEYTCYVSSDSAYDRATVTLDVTGE